LTELFYEHYTDVPVYEWVWPNFSPEEIACRGTGALKVNSDALTKLQMLRNIMAVPLIITSAYRSPEHNAAQGGAQNSMHLTGRAFDIALAGIDKGALLHYAVDVGFTGFGFAKTFMHVDTGGKRWWVYG